MPRPAWSLQSVQAADKAVKTNCVCSGAHGAQIRKLSAFHFQLSICRTPCYNVHLAAYIPFSMTEF